MTRFALIPLAILANACASAEDVQDNLTDMTHELQRDIDEMTAETDRDADAHRQNIYAVAHDMFEGRLNDQRCEIVAALAGGWADRSFRLKTNMIGRSGELIATLEGRMRYVDNATGEFGAKGHIAKPQTGVVMEGDWYRDQLEADIIIDGINQEHYEVIGLKAHRGLGGQVIGAVVACD